MKTLLLTTALCGALVLGLNTNAYGGAPENAPQAEITQHTTPADEATDKLVEDAQARLVEKAAQALSLTGKALKALEDKDTDAALEAIADAIGKLSVVTSANPELALVPIDVQQRLYDLYADADIVQDVRARTIKTLREGDIPMARQLLSNLASELVIQTTSLPLGLYPDNLKQVAPLITAGKIDEAIALLNTTLDTLVVTKVAIPLPILRAGIAVEAAREIADSDKALSEEEAGQVNALLDTARAQLRLSVALGYAKRGELKGLHQEIESVRKLVKDGQKGEGAFKTLLGHLKQETKTSQDARNATDR